MAIIQAVAESIYGAISIISACARSRKYSCYGNNLSLKLFINYQTLVREATYDLHNERLKPVRAKPITSNGLIKFLEDTNSLNKYIRVAKTTPIKM